MEAALRSAYFLVTGDNLKDVTFTAVCGISGIKEASVRIGGTEIRVAVAHQIGNIEQVLNEVKKARETGKDTPWHFIEVMACRGDCIGGGMPYGCTDEVRKLRIRGIYDEDDQSVQLPLFAPQSLHRVGVQGVPGRAREPQGPRAPVHPLRGEAAVHEMGLRQRNCSKTSSMLCFSRPR